MSSPAGTRAAEGSLTAPLPQALELWAALRCLLSAKLVGPWAPRPLDKISTQLFLLHHAEANPTACQELQGATQLCVVNLPQAEQVVAAGLPLLRNYWVSPDDVIVSGFDVPSSHPESARCGGPALAALADEQPTTSQPCYMDGWVRDNGRHSPHCPLR